MISKTHWLLAAIGVATVCVVMTPNVKRSASRASETEKTIEGAREHEQGSAAVANSRDRKSEYRLSRSDDAPINILQQRLEPLARRGDIRAASLLSREAIHCHKAASYVGRLRARQNANERLDQAAPPAGQGDEASDIDATIDAIEDFKRTHCDSMPSQELSALTRSAVKNAAMLGDADAQLCVIEQGFLRPRAPDLSPDEQANGANYLADYEEKAFNRGDWRIAQLLLARTLSRGHGPIYARVGISPMDPATYLRSLQLLKLGAVGPYATRLDKEIESFVKTTNPAMLRDHQGLSNQDIADAADWAREEFQAHFSGSPPIAEQPVPCGSY